MAWLMPVVLLLYLGFRSGGYPPGVASYAAALLALVLAVQALRGKLERPGAATATAVVALVVLAAWTVLSGSWSHAQIRAFTDADRTLLYALVVLAFATLPRPCLPQVLPAVAAAITAIATVGLAGKLLFGVAPDLAPHRLNWPLTYWNAMGMLVGLGIVLCVHLAATEARPAVRRAACAAVPVLACALYFTLSRAGAGVAVAGVVVYALLARPRGIVAAAAAAAPGTALALLGSLLSRGQSGVEASLAHKGAEGRLLTLALVIAVAGTYWLLPRLRGLDRWAEDLQISRGIRRAAAVALATGAVLLAGAVVASGASRKAYDRFLAPTQQSDIDPRGRLLTLSNNGRVDFWRVALRASRGERLRGTGAGTFALQWDRMRTTPRQATEAHSLYVETLDELGIAGAALLVVALIALPAGAILARGQPRAVRALVFVATAMWLAHAAFEWDWEMPAVSAVPLALAAAAAPGGRRRAGVPLAVAAIALAVLPALTAFTAPRVAGALRAYDAGDCAGATGPAARAKLLFDARPQPHLIAALCHARAGDDAHAIAEGREALARDPDNWEYHYDLAVLKAAAGERPTADLAAVRRLSAIPIGLQILGLTVRDRQGRRAAALAAPVLVDRLPHAAIGAGR
jgi:hypothetical protein